MLLHLIILVILCHITLVIQCRHMFQKLADDLQSMNETHGREKHDLLVKLQEYDADIKVFFIFAYIYYK